MLHMLKGEKMSIWTKRKKKIMTWMYGARGENGIVHTHKEIDDRISKEITNKSFQVATAKYWIIWSKSPKSLEEYTRTQKTFIRQHGNRSVTCKKESELRSRNCQWLSGEFILEIEGSSATTIHAEQAEQAKWKIITTSSFLFSRVRRSELEAIG